MQQQPAWLDEAWRELGQREVSGARANPRIMALFRDAGAGSIAHDETAWCAAFVGACLRRAGLFGTGSLMARSYLHWGDAVAADAGPGSGMQRLGALVVLRRGADPTLGHVGFLVGETEAELMLLGGNQSDAVTVTAFPRADVLAIRWPSAAAPVVEPTRPLESASTASSGEELFAAVLAHELDMEGGWTDDPADPGGPTNLGMTLTDIAAWHGVALDDSSRGWLLDELRRITPAQVQPIYRQRYWLASRADVLPPGLAVMHFDCAVNQGPGRAARLLQQAVGAAVDGDIGPLTLTAAAEADQETALATYAELRRQHYRSLATFARFGRGWLARVEKTLALAHALGARTDATARPSNSKGDSPMTTSSSAPSPTTTAATPAPAAGDAKWWGQSMTVWGALITAAATVVPALGPLIGIDLSSEAIRQLGGQASETMRALAGLAGTIMAIYGRSRAALPLVRRDFSLRL